MSPAPPLGQRPNEPVPGKDSLENPQGHEARATGDPAGPTCPDCGLAFGEHPEFHTHGEDGAARMDLPGRELENDQLGGDPPGG
ncbi:MAG TPA: hypothetical protein VM327_09915 [Candidatus Thermoplasmatota archaeon]|nr:hypothetical protein [Candidatus Thermoplasmatota archaeon]